MIGSRGRGQAGGLFLCWLLLCAVFQPMNEEELKSDAAALYKSGVYTLWKGVKGVDTYTWPLKENWQDTGYLYCAEGIQMAAAKERCISLQSTVGSYVPSEGEVLLRPDALYALCAMENDYPLQEGARFLQGYVTVEEQEIWRSEALERRRKVSLQNEQCPVPAGGKGEHQLGLAVDVKLTGKLNMAEKDPLRRNETGIWLAENMWRYGYVYQAEFDGCEAIHLRYVGRGHARMMHILGMNLEEYLSFLRQNKTVTLMHGETMIACVQCVTEEEEYVQIPQGMRREISRDNQGNIILFYSAE